jgi:hypothetical protein
MLGLIALFFQLPSYAQGTVLNYLIIKKNICYEISGLILSHGARSSFSSK